MELETGKATNLGSILADTRDEIIFIWKPDGSAVQFGNLLYTPGGKIQELDLPLWGWMDMQWLDNETLMYTQSSERFYESLAAFKLNPLTGETQLLSEQYQQWVAANGAGGLVTAKEVLNGVAVTREDDSTHLLNKDYRPVRLLPKGNGIASNSKRFFEVQWIYTFADSNARPLLSVLNPADFWAEPEFWGRLSYDPGKLTELYDQEPDNCSIVAALAYHYYRDYRATEAMKLMLDFEAKGYELRAPDIWSDVKREILRELTYNSDDETVLTPETMAQIHPYHLLYMADNLPASQAEIILSFIAEDLFYQLALLKR